MSYTSHFLDRRQPILSSIRVSSRTNQPIMASSSSSSERPPTENQISSLPGAKVLITTHNDEGKAVVKNTEPVKVPYPIPPPHPTPIIIISYPLSPLNHKSHQQAHAHSPPPGPRHRSTYTLKLTDITCDPPPTVGPLRPRPPPNVHALDYRVPDRPQQRGRH